MLAVAAKTGVVPGVGHIYIFPFRARRPTAAVTGLGRAAHSQAGTLGYTIRYIRCHTKYYTPKVLQLVYACYYVLLLYMHTLYFVWTRIEST